MWWEFQETIARKNRKVDIYKGIYDLGLMLTLGMQKFKTFREVLALLWSSLLIEDLHTVFEFKWPWNGLEKYTDDFGFGTISMLRVAGRFFLKP